MPRPRHAAALALAAVLTSAAPAAASVEIRTDPRLKPRFDVRITDYAIRCEPGEPVRVKVHATDGDRVAIAGSDRHGGTFERKVSRESGARFTIRVRSDGRSSKHHVRCVPPGFPAWGFQRNGGAQAAGYVMTPLHHKGSDYVVIVDGRGIPVWWWRGTTFAPADGKLMPDGTIAFTRTYGDHFGVRDKGGYEIRRPDGTLVRLLRAVGSPTDTHDMQPAGNGNYLVDTYRRRCCVDLSPHGGPAKAEVFDGEIQELTPGGKLVWSWSTRGRIPPSWTTGDETKGIGWWAGIIGDTPHRPVRERAYDLVHINSMEPDRDGMIVSARHIDSVFRIDRATGEIDWKLGGVEVPGKSLKLVGPHPTPLFSGQHDARLWKDGTLTVYDNSSWSPPPSADRFAIDPVKRTARLVEHITNPEVEDSVAIGSARKLEGGNWVVDWGGHPFVTEQTEDGTIARRLELGGGRGTYRAVPIEKRDFQLARLRRGMDRMNASHRGPGRGAQTAR